MLRLVTLLLICLTTTYGDSSCGDWIPYKDEKCFKLFTKLATEQNAKSYCQDIQSVLVNIQTQEEQDFISKRLKSSGIADNVWIGVKKQGGKFIDISGKDLYYTNWNKDRPMVNKRGYDCVEISTDGLFYAKWNDENCLKSNAFVCEKSLTWSMRRLQDSLIETKIKLMHLEQNSIPIGFIYVQLSNQSDPKTLWPNTEWESVSEKYAGLFFRSEGGGANSLGQIQDQQQQTVLYKNGVCTGDCIEKSTRLNRSGEAGPTYGPLIWVGGNSGTDIGIALQYSQKEIRPRNTAIRIWKRIK